MSWEEICDNWGEMSNHDRLATVGKIFPNSLWIKRKTKRLYTVIASTGERVLLKCGNVKGRWMKWSSFIKNYYPLKEKEGSVFENNSKNDQCQKKPQWLRLKVLSLSDSKVTFCIHEQTYRGKEFGNQVITVFEEKFGGFKSSNGIIIWSEQLPQFQEEDFLFVRGSIENFDNKELTASIPSFKRILQAVIEFNEMLGGEQHQSFTVLERMVDLLAILNNQKKESQTQQSLLEANIKEIEGNIRSVIETLNIMK